jgi:hypothetical protein
MQESKMDGTLLMRRVCYPNKTDRYHIADLLLNVALKHHIPFPKMNVTLPDATSNRMSLDVTLPDTTSNRMSLDGGRVR